MGWGRDSAKTPSHAAPSHAAPSRAAMRSGLGATSPLPAAPLPWRRWPLRPEQRDVVAVVLADELHDLVDAGARVARERARRAPAAGGLVRILEDDLVEDVRGARPRQTLDGVELVA